MKQRTPCLLFIVTILLFSCKKSDPILSTEVTLISSNGAKFSGEIADPKGNIITEFGVVYGLQSNPTTSDSVIVAQETNNSFDTITSLSVDYPHILQSGKTYYARSYVKYKSHKHFSAIHTAYGNEVTFNTLGVGGIGPGGGVIYYDKGNADGGWQYLEASTTTIGTTYNWGCNGTFLGTNTKIGIGASNTNLISASCGSADNAAKLCANLVQGGQNDWFLPSLDELNLIYLNSPNTIASGVCWSSSEYDANYVYTYIVYSFGSSGYDKKGKNYTPALSIVPVRAF